MKIAATEIVDTFAEAFRMHYVRLVVTAHDDYWLAAAVREFTGYGSSVIACDAEVGVERNLPPGETPDGRPGAAILAFGFSPEALAKAVPKRAGQCLMTCPTTAVFDGLPNSETRVPLGKHLRFFGDGYQKSKKLEGRRYWRIPVMDGEFLCEDVFGTIKGVAGGNFLILGISQAAALQAAEAAVAAIAAVPGIIMPFPGGVVRSGSKVGSRYKKLRASTNDAYCPTLRGSVTTALPEGVNATYEIVFDGLDLAAVEEATRVGVRAACQEGIVQISAGNYGGKLGPFHLHLHKLLA